MKTFGKFGLKDAERALGVLKAKNVQVSTKDAAMLAALIEAMGVPNVAHQQAAAEEQHQKAVAHFALRNAQDAEAAGTAKANGLRQRCDNAVATIRALVEKVVTAVADHYRALAARAEEHAEAKAEALRAEAREAEGARAKAQEIADLF